MWRHFRIGRETAENGAIVNHLCLTRGSKISAIKKYTTNFYGSTNWELDYTTHMVYNSLRTTIKDCYKVPRATHRYIVDLVLDEEISVKDDLMGR